MIRIGFTAAEKVRVVKEYLTTHTFDKLFVFYYKKFKPNYDQVHENIEYVEYSDIEMYKYFYRLLEEINDRVLLIFDGCMRTQNRSELIYNCAHHYCNQTPHKIVFEDFPFIEDSEDFMILLDFLDKSKWKGKSFKWRYFDEIDLICKRWPLALTIIQHTPTEKQLAAYEKKKDALFDGLGKKHPDTIPRELALYVGSFKKPYIESDKLYIARNQRFKLENVASLANPDDKQRILIDMPHRRLDFIDYLKLANVHDWTFIHSGMKVDNFYVNDYNEWVARLEEFYAKASVQ